MSSDSYFLDAANGESSSRLSTPRTPTIEISVTVEVTQTVCDDFGVHGTVIMFAALSVGSATLSPLVIMSTNATRTALELTQVYYHKGSPVSFSLAIITLSPILLQASYAALALFTREILIMEMWAGQLACEVLNWVAKHTIKQPRPADTYGKGYGFPSSHSQYMGYFAAFIALHVVYRCNPSRTANAGLVLRALESLRRPAIILATSSWAAAVCYSRMHLTYHTPDQVYWGAGIGIAFGYLTYAFCELLPARYPTSIPGRIRRAVLAHPVVTYFMIRDSWAVWPDGGYEQAYSAWRQRWDAAQPHHRNGTSGKIKQS
ncbi:PAP2-domain-containing protein [Auricularia subglabra TFB-10046 SS5]|nr:PAP2-domain-containing protein [Auricularia subglabra TFB-10046 SS5]